MCSGRRRSGRQHRRARVLATALELERRRVLPAKRASASRGDGLWPRFVARLLGAESHVAEGCTGAQRVCASPARRCAGLSRLAVSYYFKDELHMEPATLCAAPAPRCPPGAARAAL